MMNRANNKQQQQQQQQQIRSSKTMPQLNYTRADIQEQYLSKTRVRQETQALAERQQQANKRQAARPANSELRHSVKLKRSQQLAKFDDATSSTVCGHRDSESQQSPLRESSENLRDSSHPKSREHGDLKRKRSHSASRLLSACFSIPSQLANSIQHSGGSPSSSKSRASSILSHFRLGGGGGANQYKNRRTTGGCGGEYQDDLEDTQTGDDWRDSRPQMRPLSNSRTLGNMQHLHNQENIQTPPLDTDSLDSGQPGGSRMKHVSFGGGGGTSIGTGQAGERPQNDKQQQQQQPMPVSQATNAPTTQINVINNKPALPPPHHAQVTGKTTAICRQPISSMQPIGGISQVPPMSQQQQQQQQLRNQAAPPRPPAVGKGGTNPPLQGPIYKRLPNVPMRTQATQTEITAYHLMASPAGSSAPTPSMSGQPTRSVRSTQLDTPSQRSTPTNSSTLASEPAAGPSSKAVGGHPAATPATASGRVRDHEAPYGQRANQEAEEEDLDERADGGLNVSLLESSSSNSSSTHSLVGHDSALADTLQCDLKIGSQPAAQPAEVSSTRRSSIASAPSCSGSINSKTSITKTTRTKFDMPPASCLQQQRDGDEIPSANEGADGSWQSGARGANMHELAAGPSNPIVGGGERTEIEPPNRFKDDGQTRSESDEDDDDELEPASLVSEASSQTDGSLLVLAAAAANSRILDHDLQADRAAQRASDERRPMGATEADNAPISLSEPPIASTEVTAAAAAAAIGCDDDATPKPTPSHERLGGAETELAADGAGGGVQLCEQAESSPSESKRELNDSDEAMLARSTFDIGKGALAEPTHESAVDDDRQQQREQRLASASDNSSSASSKVANAPPPQQPTPAELRRDDFLTLRRSHRSGQNNEYCDHEDDAADRASQSSAQTATTTTTTTGPIGPPAGSALLSATLEDVEPISLSSALVSSASASVCDETRLSASRVDDDETTLGGHDGQDYGEDEHEHDDGRLVAQRLELIEDQRQFQMAVAQATLEDIAGPRGRARQSSTSTLSTRHHSYCSTSAAGPELLSSPSPPQSPDFYNRRLDSDDSDDVEPPPAAAAAGDALEAAAVPTRTLAPCNDHPAPVAPDLCQMKQVTSPSGSSPSSSTSSGSSRRTLKSRQESRAAEGPAESRRQSATGTTTETAPASRGERDGAEREEEKEMERASKSSSSSPSSSSSQAREPNRAAMVSVALATNGQDKTGLPLDDSSAANDPPSSSLAADRSGQPITAERQDARQANNGKPHGGWLEAGQVGQREVEVAAQIEANSTTASTSPDRRRSSTREPSSVAIEREQPRRTSSPPSPPTTVSDLDASEELSTASFVDNYKRCLEAQVGELADSFASGLIGECLAATANEANRPSGASEQRRDPSGPPSACSSVASPPLASFSASPSSSSSSSSPSSSSSATTTTSIGGSSYVCLESGEIKRREQTLAPQQAQPVARPLVPKKPAHLIGGATCSASQSSGGHVAPCTSQFESIREAERGANTGEQQETVKLPKVDTTDNHPREQERAAAVAVAATSIAAALHQSSQQKHHQQQQQLEAAKQATGLLAKKEGEKKEAPASGDIVASTSIAQLVAEDATCREVGKPEEGVSNEAEKLHASAEDEDLLQPQSLIELSTVSEVSNESTAGELSGASSSQISSQKQQATGEEEKRERFPPMKNRSESLEPSPATTAATSSISSAQVSQAPAKRRRSSSGERQTQLPVVAKIVNYTPPSSSSSLARSSPVDCPYPHDIIQPLPSPPVSLSQSTATPSTSTTTVAPSTIANGTNRNDRIQTTTQDEDAHKFHSTSCASTCSAAAKSSAATPSANPAPTSQQQQQQPLVKRLSHDDTMEAIEDDVEGEEHEMRLDEAERSCSQTPEPSIAPPAGFAGGTSESTCVSTQLSRRLSSSLGGQSIKEEDEEEDHFDDGAELTQESEQRENLDEEEEEDEENDDEESSISVSQQHGVVVVTQEQRRRSRQPTLQSSQSGEQSVEPTGSGIQMKRFKKSSSNSSSSSSSSSSSTAAHATPISSPASTPSKSSSSSSSSSTKTADPSDKSQCEPLVDEDDAAAAAAGGSHELASPKSGATTNEPPPPVMLPTTSEKVDNLQEPIDETIQQPNEERSHNEFATHAILEHLSRRNPSLAAAAQLEEPPQSLELSRSIDPQQRRASWRRESETSRLGSSSSSAATIASSVAAAATTSAPTATHIEPVQQQQRVRDLGASEKGGEFAPTSTMKRRHKQPSVPAETSCDNDEPLAVETIPMQIDNYRRPLATDESIEKLASSTANTSAAPEELEETLPLQSAGSKRRPPLKQLKSPNQQQQQQQQRQLSNSFDRTEADGSICSSCSCMEASLDQNAPPVATGPASGAQMSKQVVAVQPTQQRPPQPVATTSVDGSGSGPVAEPGSTSGPSSAWMSQEEGTVFTENYWLSHWLYISEHEEAEIWRRAIDMTGGAGPTGSGQTQQQQAAEVPATIAGMPACMTETGSTASERSFNSRYKSTTRKMIHRRASIEMYKRIMSNSLRREKRIEISRSSVGEFGFRIHGSRPVVVSAIERGTSAETCGLQVGDVIYAINDTNILDMAHSDVVRLAHQADATSALVLDLIPTNGFLRQQQQQQQQVSPTSKRYEPTVTGHLMRLSASTAQPLLVQLQERIAAEGGLASAKERAAKLTEVMRRAWRPRYFVLRADNCLYWYKSARDTIEPHGGLNLQGFSATLTDEFSEPSYVIRLVKYGGQPHYLGSNNLCDVQTWVDAINRAATEANQCDPYMKRTLVLARGKPQEIREPDCSGWLYKFSHKRGGGAHWRAAYFVLKDACLYLFRSQRAELVEQASAVYYLHGYRVRSKHIEHKRHTFELVPPNRKTIKPMFLMASNEIDKKRWIAALEYSIDRWIEINQTGP